MLDEASGQIIADKGPVPVSYHSSSRLQSLRTQLSDSKESRKGRSWTSCPYIFTFVSHVRNNRWPVYVYHSKEFLNILILVGSQDIIWQEPDHADILSSSSRISYHRRPFISCIGFRTSYIIPFEKACQRKEGRGANPIFVNSKNTYIPTSQDLLYITMQIKAGIYTHIQLIIISPELSTGPQLNPV
jgi:hypothetical protein